MCHTENNQHCLLVLIKLFCSYSSIRKHKAYFTQHILKSNVFSMEAGGLILLYIYIYTYCISCNSHSLQAFDVIFLCQNFVLGILKLENIARGVRIPKDFVCRDMQSTDSVLI